jgi:CheY-like chemotaxis protein
VQRGGCGRRIDPQGKLGAGVEGVLQPRQLVHVRVDQVVGRAFRDALETRQRGSHPLPEICDGGRVRQPLSAPNGPLHSPGIIRGYSSPIARIAHPVVAVGDDDSAFRMLVRLNLELEGYSVLEAGTAQDVRKLLGSNEIDLLLLDVRLGDDDGVQLAGELRAEHPDLAIAFLTGSVFGFEDDARSVSDAVVQKPFTLEELSETVARLTRR